MNAATQPITSALADRYDLVKRVGEGSTGEVWEAVHRELGRKVAVKLLKPECVDRGNTRRRFLTEARALASIESHYVVSVFDIGETSSGAPFMVMNLLNGATLRSVIGSGALTQHDAVRLLIDAGRGVATIHAAGFVHRDLKPENLFVSRRDNDAETCTVLDLGLAKHEAGENLTRDGALVGTVRYMAPEQARGEATSPQTDIHALGLVLYEALTGQSFFNEPTEAGQLFRIMNPRAPHDAQLASLPAPLAAILRRALAVEPAARWSSASEFVDALRDVAGSDRSVPTSDLLLSFDNKKKLALDDSTLGDNETLQSSSSVRSGERHRAPEAMDVSASAAERALSPAPRKRVLGIGAIVLAILALGTFGVQMFRHDLLGAKPLDGTEIVAAPAVTEPAPAERPIVNLTQPVSNSVPLDRQTLPAIEQPSPPPVENNAAVRTGAMRRPAARSSHTTARAGERAVNPPRSEPSPHEANVDPAPAPAASVQRFRYAEENPYEATH